LLQYPETLTAHLDRLRVPNESESFGDRSKILDGFVRQGYLARQKLTLESNQSDRAVFQYSWGLRSKAEVPEENMVGFISSVSSRKSEELVQLHVHLLNKLLAFNVLGLQRTRK
jgi:MAGE family